MRVCVVADLHGRLPQIPDCDVLILAGDICPDIDRVGWDPDLMRVGQMEWLGNEYYEWEQALPTEHIFATPGNHDWVHQFPEHCLSKMFIDELWEHDGKKFWFTPWVIRCGDWNYQATREARRYYFDNIPDKLDLLVHHSPAFEVGDRTYGDPGEPVGCPELRAAIQKKRPRYSTFGHIHEGLRFGSEYHLGETVMYHASMWGAQWTPVVFDIK